jgi:hypothetical protein
VSRDVAERGKRLAKSLCALLADAESGLLIEQRPRCQKSYGKTSTGLGEDFLLLVL